MSKTKKSSHPTAINDVAHPGTSAPSDTSKSIINQRPIMKDPMMVEDDKPGAAAKQPLSKKTSETKIAPPGEKDENDKPEDDVTAPEAKSKPEPEAKAETETEDDSEEDADESSEADKRKSKTEADAKTVAQTEADTKLLKLVEGKKYFLPINAVEHRRSARFVAMGIILALVLAVAWVDIALDAGLIHLGSVKPVTHLFSN